MTNSNEAVDCPFELDGTGAVQHSEFNNVLRLVNRFHLTPIKTKLDEVAAGHEAHVKECGLRQAEIMGGLKTLKMLWAGIAALFSALVATLGFAAVTLAKYMGWF